MFIVCNIKKHHPQLRILLISSRNEIILGVDYMDNVEMV